LGGVLTRDGVEKHQVLEVGDLTPLPALSHVGCLEELLGSGQRNASAGRKRQKNIKRLYDGQIERSRTKTVAISQVKQPCCKQRSLNGKSTKVTVLLIRKTNVH